MPSPADSIFSHWHRRASIHYRILMPLHAAALPGEGCEVRSYGHQTEPVISHFPHVPTDLLTIVRPARVPPAAVPVIGDAALRGEAV
jgi:hypothetical protein